MISARRSLSSLEIISLILVGGVLSWKLLRLIAPSPLTWDLHNYAIIVAGLISVTLTVKHNLYLGVSKTSLVILVFVCLTIARLGVTGVIDSFTVCSLAFASYFIILGWTIRNGFDLAFRYFEFLLLILFLFNLFDFIDANTEMINFISYEIPAFKLGTLGELGNTSQFIWASSMQEGVVVRSVGVAGTHYASSGLTAATCVYALVMKRRLLFGVTLLLLVLWGVGSSIAAALFGIFLIQARSKWAVVYLAVGAFLFIVILQSRGFDIAHNLNIKVNVDAIDFLLSLAMGEGRSVSSIQTEFRFLGLLFSLGGIGTALFLIMLLNYYTYSKYQGRFAESNNFRAGLFFILVLLISTLHYNTLFVFPNLFFVVALTAFASAGFAQFSKNMNNSPSVNPARASRLAATSINVGAE